MIKRYLVLPAFSMLLLINNANAVSALPTVNFTESTGSAAMRNNLTQCVNGKLCDLPVINTSELFELTDYALRGNTIVYSPLGPAHGYNVERGYIHSNFNNQRLALADELEIQITVPNEIQFIQDCEATLSTLYTQDGTIAKHADTIDCWGGYLRFNGAITPSYDSTSGARLINNDKWLDYDPTAFITVDNWLDPSFYLNRWDKYFYGKNRTFQSTRRGFRFKNPRYPNSTTASPNKTIIEYDYEIVDIGDTVIPIPHNDGTPADIHTAQNPIKTGAIRVARKSSARMVLKCAKTSIINPVLDSHNLTSTEYRGKIALTREMNVNGTAYLKNKDLAQIQQSCPSALTLELLYIRPLGSNPALSQLSIRYGTFTDETQYWQDYGNEVLKDLQIKYRVWDDLNTINTKLGGSNAQILQYMRDYSSTALTGNVKDLLMLFYASKGMDPVAALQTYPYFYSTGVLKDILIPVVDFAAAPQPDWQIFYDLYNTGGANESIDFVFYMQMLTNLNQVRINGSVTTLNNLVNNARKKLDNELARSKYFVALSEHAIQATKDNLCKIRAKFAAVPDMALAPVTCKTQAALQQINHVNGIKVDLNPVVSTMPISGLKLK